LIESLFPIFSSFYDGIISAIGRVEEERGVDDDRHEEATVLKKGRKEEREEERREKGEERREKERANLSRTIYSHLALPSVLSPWFDETMGQQLQDAIARD